MINLNNPSLEQTVLSTLMSINNAWDQADFLTANDFSFSSHRAIFESIELITKSGKHPDAVLVADHLLGRHILNDIGGEQAIVKMLADSPAIFNIKPHAQKLAELGRRRNADAVLTQAIASVRDNLNEPTDAILGACVMAIDALSAATESDGAVVNDSSDAVLAMMQDVLSDKSKGVPTGFVELDNKISGLVGGQLIIVAARPAMGKSLFASNVADQVSQTTGKPFLIFQMEMQQTDMMVRVMASRARVPIGKIKTATWDANEWARIEHANQEFVGNGKLLFCCQGGMSPAQVTAIAKQMHRQYGGLSGIMVDYIQLMRVPNHKGNRENEVSEISRSLKALAMLLDVPVIALSQLNRSLEQRPNKRPVMSDLRESGAIEQDADVILFIYRDEVYNENTQSKGFAELIIGKQRQGDLGKVILAFRGEFGCFENCTNQVSFEDE